MIDLDRTIRVLDDCQHLAGLLNGRNVSDRPDLQSPATGRQKRNNSVDDRAEIAEVRRELVRLADQLDLAAALVRNEYHVMRGHTDLLEGE